jgi:hypothetical protein
MKNGPQPARAEFTRAPGREWPRSRNRPTARLPSDHTPRARPPCGPRRKSAQRPARAQRVLRSRPQPGPGPGKSHPGWAETRSGECEPSISIRRLREVSGRTKTRSTPSRNLSPHSDFLRPTHAPQRSRATPSADEREQRERARGAALSPSPVCALTVG